MAKNARISVPRYRLRSKADAWRIGVCGLGRIGAHSGFRPGRGWVGTPLHPRRKEAIMEILGLIALGLTTLAIVVYAEFSELD